MHPAFSVLIFTVTAGAGYGLLGWLSANELFEWWSLTTSGKILVGVIAMVLISVGLSASTLHLTNPKNAWLSFSRFRTSWLSREAVLAIVLYPIAALYAVAIYWQWPSTTVLACLSLVLSLAIVFTTSMIYASLKTIRQWYTPLVPILFMLFATISGGLAWVVLLAWQGVDIQGLSSALSLLVLVTASVKVGYFVWYKVPGTSSIQSATGFTQHKVSMLDAGHSAPSFLNHEFIYNVEQTRLIRLRWAMFTATFVLPLIILLLAPNNIVLPLGWLIMIAGLLIERWLFFAEARHVVRLLHGEQRV
jgi:DMSO reductase anchor subunit